jgi:hypothetical protein
MLYDMCVQEILNLHVIYQYLNHIDKNS